MNIDQYRALKAEQAQQAEQPVDNKPSTETVIEKPDIVEEKKIEDVSIKTPEKIVIDGIGEVTIDELKNGYLRQSDYTKKTQEVAAKRKEYEEAVQLYETVKANPELAQTLSQKTAVPESLDPATARIRELESAVYDMMIEKEIEVLQAKYEDFDVRETLETAQAKRLNNLEDAYLLNRAKKQPNTKSTSSDVPTAVDLDTIKEQIKQDLLKQFEEERGLNTSLISAGGGKPVINDKAPKLTGEEAKVARMMKMSESEYAQWRDAGRKPK